MKADGRDALLILAGAGIASAAGLIVALLALAVLMSGCSPDILTLHRDTEIATGPVASAPVAISVVFADGTHGRIIGPTAAIVPRASSYSLDERRAIVAMVRAWYAPFGVAVSLGGDSAYSVLVTDSLADEIDASANYSGSAIMYCDRPRPGQATAFGYLGVLLTAVTVAQESAHTLGLEHSSSKRDLMYPFLSGAELRQGFLDEDLTTAIPDDCNRGHQNSAAMLRKLTEDRT